MSSLADEQYEKWSAVCEMLTDMQKFLSMVGDKLFSNGYLSPVNEEEFNLGMNYFWLCSWPIGFHLNKLYNESVSIAKDALQTDNYKYFANLLISDIIDPIEKEGIIEFWQMIMDSTKAQNDRRFNDQYYSKKGGFLCSVESILKFTTTISREALMLWTIYSDHPDSHETNKELQDRVLRAIAESIEEYLPDVSVDFSEAPYEAGIESVDLLSVLEIAQQKLNAEWALDYEGADKLNRLTLFYIVKWIEQRLTGR